MSGHRRRTLRLYDSRDFQTAPIVLSKALVHYQNRLFKVNPKLFTINRLLDGIHENRISHPHYRECALRNLRATGQSHIVELPNSIYSRIIDWNVEWQRNINLLAPGNLILCVTGRYSGLSSR